MLSAAQHDNEDTLQKIYLQFLFQLKRYY